MPLIAVLGVAVALGTDAFSLAVGLGMAGVRRVGAWRLSLAVGLLHVGMPLAGLVLGAYLGRLLGDIAGLVGGLVLVAIGVQMLWEGFRAHQELTFNGRSAEVVLGSFWGIVSLAGSVSMDALSVGFGLGALEVSLPLAVTIMGMVAAAMTTAGFIFGQQAGKLAGRRAQLLGGLVLVFIGVRLIWR